MSDHQDGYEGTPMDEWEYSDLNLALLDSMSLKSMLANEDAEDESVSWEGENESVKDWNENESLGEAEIVWAPRPLLKEGEIAAPDVEQLTRALCGTDYIKPSCLLAMKWLCPDCWLMHDGTINYIADLQDNHCSRCLMKNPVAYEWTLTRCSLNGISLDFTEVHDQEGPTCILYSVLSLCDMSRRVRGAKRQCDESTLLDPYALHAKFQQVAGYRLDDETATEAPDENSDLETMLIVACRYGVPYRENSAYDYEVLRNVPSSFERSMDYIARRSLKVSSWFRVSSKDVTTIARLIAHGKPLLAVIPVGKCFVFLPGGEVYFAPNPDGCGTHAVVLHGSGTAMPNAAVRETKPGKPTERELFFKARNSHGNWAHPSFEKKGKGADFNIWAVDLCGDAYGVNLSILDD